MNNLINFITLFICISGTSLGLWSVVTDRSKNLLITILCTLTLFILGLMVLSNIPSEEKNKNKQDKIKNRRD